MQVSKKVNSVLVYVFNQHFVSSMQHVVTIKHYQRRGNKFFAHFNISTVYFGFV